MLKALGVDAVRPELAKKIKAEAPFLPAEERSEKIAKLVDENADEAMVNLSIRVPRPVYQTILDVAKLHDLTVTSAAVRLMLLGANKLGSVYDRKRIEEAVRKLVTEVLLPIGRTMERDEDDPYSVVDPRLLGRGLATELIRAKKKDE